MSAPDSEPKQSGKRDSSTGMKPKLQQDEEGWAILLAMGNYSLEDCKHIIRDYITQIYSKPPPPGWRYIQGYLRPCPECYCENPRAHVHWKEMAKLPKTFFRVEDLPKGFQLLDPSHLRQEDLLTLWEFLTSRQKDEQVGLMFSGCTHEIKHKTLGWDLPGRPRERGQTSQGMINHHHPLMMRTRG